MATLTTSEHQPHSSLAIPGPRAGQGRAGLRGEGLGGRLECPAPPQLGLQQGSLFQMFAVISCLANVLTWRVEPRLGHHGMRLETKGDPFREWSHVQGSRAPSLETGQYAGGQESVFRDLPEDRPVGEDSVISFVLGGTKG